MGHTRYFFYGNSHTVLYDPCKVAGQTCVCATVPRCGVVDQQGLCAWVQQRAGQLPIILEPEDVWVWVPVGSTWEGQPPPLLEGDGDGDLGELRTDWGGGEGGSELNLVQYNFCTLHRNVLHLLKSTAVSSLEGHMML